MPTGGGLGLGVVGASGLLWRQQLASEVSDDLSGNGNDATPVNMEDVDFPADTASGTLWSASFDGVNEHFDLGNVHAFEVNQPFSITVWFKTAATGGYLMAKIGPSTNFRGYGIAMESGGGVDFILASNVASNIRATVRTSGAFNDSTWRHIACTYDGSETAAGMLLYIDRSLVAMDAPPFDNLSGSMVTTDALNFGARTNGTGAFLNGNIDELGIYDDVLTLAEIQAIGATNQPNLNGLSSFADHGVGYWKLGEKAA